MLEVTISIYSGNGGLAVQKLQNTSLVAESGSLQCPRSTHLLDGHLSSRRFFSGLVHEALSQCSKVSGGSDNDKLIYGLT